MGIIQDHTIYGDQPQALVDDVRRVMAEAGKVTETTLQSHGRFSVSTYRRRIGGMDAIREVVQ